MYRIQPWLVKRNVGGDPKKISLHGCRLFFRSESLHKISLVFASLLFRRATVSSVPDCWKSIRSRAALYFDWFVRLFSLRFFLRHTCFSDDCVPESDLRRAAPYSDWLTHSYQHSGFFDEQLLEIDLRRAAHSECSHVRK